MTRMAISGYGNTPVIINNMHLQNVSKIAALKFKLTYHFNLTAIAALPASLLKHILYMGMPGSYDH